MIYLVCLNISTSLLPLAFIFPMLETIYFNYFLLLGTFLFWLGKGDKCVSLPQNKFIYSILVVYILSEMQHFWISGIIHSLEVWIYKLILYLLLINCVSSAQDFRKVFWTIFLTAAVLSLLGWDIYLNNPELLHDRGRIESLGNYNLSNSFGLLLTVVWPLGFFLMETERGFGRKIVLLCLLAFLLITLVYTKSRGSLLGMSAAVVMSIFYSRKLFHFKILKALAAAGFFLGLSYFAMKIVLSRADVTSFTGAGGEASAGDRLMAWIAAIKMAIDHPLLGVGWGRATDAFREYGFGHAFLTHNTPLNVLAELGFIGFFCYVAYMYQSLKQLFLIRNVWKKEQAMEKMYLFACGLFIALICFNINTMFSVKDHEPSLWILLGVIGAMCNYYSKLGKEGHIPIASPSTPPVPSRRW